MNQLYEALYTDATSGKLLYRLRLKNVWNKYFWEKAKLEQLELTHKKHDLPKSQIEILDLTKLGL